MVVWTGLGFLIAIIGIAALVGAQILAEKLTGNPNFYQENTWVLLAGMLVAAVVTFGLNKTILKSKSKTVIDKETGQEMLLKNDHSLFFITSKWWPIIFVGIGIISLAVGYVKG